MVLSRIRTISGKSTLQITPQVYQLYIRATSTILIIEEELTIIDTGLPGSSTRIINFINSLGRSIEEVSLIIITHNHIDHAGGLAELRKLTRAKVAAHKADLHDAEAQMPYPKFIRRLLRVPSLNTFHSGFLLKPEDVDIHLEGGEVLKPLGGLEVIHTPGHTPGSISLFSPKNKLLIVSDALTRQNRKPGLPHKSVSSDFPQAINSIKEMANLDIDILCFGHGQPLIGDVSTKMRELIEQIKD
jgi:glyoxylase-like metal-dependent hydrolase (beta-lactamase superfamily II)